MTTKPELLLHQCCAPCSAGFVPVLEKEFAIKGIWFNPNIHPSEEHEKRRDSLVQYDSAKMIDLSPKSLPAVSEDEWLGAAPRERDKRCEFCYTLRLERTAGEAAKRGISKFSTTLLSSPFQKHELIKRIGSDIAKNAGLEFIYFDTRDAYFEGKDSARKNGSYIQRYCGCIYSIQERKQKGPK